MTRRVHHVVAVLTAIVLATGSALLLVEPAQAASSRVKVARPVIGNGTITTPEVVRHGKARVTSVSYRISKSGKTVARTRTSGKRIRVPAGTYKVKTVVKYRVGSKKKTFRKIVKVRVSWNSPIMTRAEYNRIRNGMSRTQLKNIVGSSGKFYECDAAGVCNLFFRSTTHRHLVRISYTDRVTGKNGFPGTRIDYLYDLLF